jgi:hypothetical protein
MSLTEMRLQRDQALACMILSICISVAVFLSVFGKGDSLAIASAKNAVAIHEGLLRDNAKVLQRNQDELNSIQSALQNMRKAQRH